MKVILGRSIALRLKMKNKKSQLGCVLFQKEHEIDKMKSFAFAGRFPLILNVFLVGALERVRVGPLICCGLFLMKPLHTFSAGHYSGPTVHKESCWSVAATCDDSEAPQQSFRT